MKLDVSRRGLFGLFAGAAALPVATRLPEPEVQRLTRVVPGVNSNSSAAIVQGFTITNEGSGYKTSPIITF